MLLEIFQSLENWIDAENKEARQDGFPEIPLCEFRIVGQSALIEAKLDLKLTTTGDVDAYIESTHAVKMKLKELLSAIGLELDPLGQEVWMPEETRYEILFEGRWVKAFLAAPVFILVSKAAKAPEKNRDLLIQYLAAGASKEFFDLCLKYEIDLDQLVEEKA